MHVIVTCTETVNNQKALGQDRSKHFSTKNSKQPITVMALAAQAEQSAYFCHVTDMAKVCTLFSHSENDSVVTSRIFPTLCPSGS